MIVSRVESPGAGATRTDSQTRANLTDKFKMRTMSSSWRSYIAIIKAEKRNGVLSPLVEKETTKEELFVSKSPGDSR